MLEVESNFVKGLGFHVVKSASPNNESWLLLEAVDDWEGVNRGDEDPNEIVCEDVTCSSCINVQRTPYKQVPVKWNVLQISVLYLAWRWTHLNSSWPWANRHFLAYLKILKSINPKMHWKERLSFFFFYLQTPISCQFLHNSVLKSWYLRESMMLRKKEKRKKGMFATFLYKVSFFVFVRLNLKLNKACFELFSTSFPKIKINVCELKSSVYFLIVVPTEREKNI